MGYPIFYVQVLFCFYTIPRALASKTKSEQWLIINWQSIINRVNLGEVGNLFLIAASTRQINIKNM